ncbi:MAG: sugar transferase [Candidatus Doudnabacteria bacterium]|nr:sugar transferase [Candidatus Doudnabacteria bacterium]
MKKSELLFNLISIFVDEAMVIVAGIAAFYLRFRISNLRPVLYQLRFEEYFKILILVSPIILLLLALAGLYNLKGTRRLSSEIVRIALSISSGLLIVVILFFFNETVFPSRLIILFSWMLTIVLISLGRMILRFVQVQMLKKGVGLHKLVVVIDEQNQESEIIQEIRSRPELGFQTVGTIKSSAPIEIMMADLEAMRMNSGIDELLQADPNLNQSASTSILRFCRDYGILYNFVPNTFETARTNVAVETISGIPVITLKGTPLEGWGKVVKRLMDIIISLLGLILASPLFVLVAIAIKLNSKGPVFFHQPRAAGLGEFEFYKFRSMHHQMSEGTAEGDRLRQELEKQNARQGPFVKIKNDPRVTSVGRFIRRTKLDELPQLWHILTGKMSLVGPRVHMVKEVDHFRNDYKRLFVLKPGATGLTQIVQATDNPEISWAEEIRLDEFYIENWSIWLDIYIIFKTVLILLGHRPKVDY